MIACLYPDITFHLPYSFGSGEPESTTVGTFTSEAGMTMTRQYACDSQIIPGLQRENFRNKQLPFMTTFVLIQGIPSINGMGKGFQCKH